MEQAPQVEVGLNEVWVDPRLGANVCVAYVAETGQDETAAGANWEMDVIVHVSAQDGGEIGRAIAYWYGHGYGEDETGAEDEEQTTGAMLEVATKTGTQTRSISHGSHYAAVVMEWLQHYKKYSPYIEFA